jgi:hypothetical protein
MISMTRIVVAGLAIAMTIGGLAFGFPAFFRYQDRQEAGNRVAVTEIQIRNTNQLVEVEKKKAEVRVAEAHGIAESQRIIDTSLTTNYLTYLAIGAQKEMAHSPNHTQIYIPVGNSGIPLVKNVDANANDHPAAAAK